MSLRFAVILIVLGVVGVVQGQSALQEMVKTEQAFSWMAQDTNPREAFMAFIADDGLLFRPGAVNGKKADVASVLGRVLSGMVVSTF